jgi:Mrp family chromosome partitioning ATPase
MIPYYPLNTIFTLLEVCVECCTRPNRQSQQVVTLGIEINARRAIIQEIIRQRIVMRPSTNILTALNRSFTTYPSILQVPSPKTTYSKGLPRTGTIPNLTRGLPAKQRIRNVAKVIAVASAKGGVGKSTVAGTSLSST